MPVEIYLLHKLKSLNLKNNQLKGLPEHPSLTIGQMGELETLDISYNKLEKMTSSIGECSKLRHLLLIGNHLVEVPQSVGDLASLETVSLEWFVYQNPPKQIMSGEQFKSVIKNGCNFVDFVCYRNVFQQKLSEVRF